MRHRTAVLLALFAGVSRAWAQPAQAPLPIPTTELGMRDWGVAIIRRTAALLASPDKWNRAEAGPCEPDASTLSLRCALSRAADDVAGRTSGPKPALAAAALVECHFHPAAQRAEGNCGEFF